MNNDLESIKKVIYNYATFADNRQTQDQYDLFLPINEGGMGMSVKYPGMTDDQIEHHNTADALYADFDQLHNYPTTFHFVGQVDVKELSDNSATALVYTIAHHVVPQDDGSQKLMLAYIK
ncbi:nuclear transport factor 2 family protein [Pediococcus argentinicus]|uniref:nuclear transport factor 2 family protein n=1 Tax=Pediococcus argentinicus TaxID=480391 RepID=UPI00338F926B